ncbi:hypothetical protein [Lysobacter panacisoli]|nr:hypothetical protein [Lysobacter panacisoli]
MAVFLLAGCATRAPVASDESVARSGQVGMREISGAFAQAQRMTLADNESFLVPLEDEANPSPAYPTALLAQQLPSQAVCVRVAIDEAGTVMSSTPAVQPPECPALDAADTAFFDAVAHAVAQWHYEPGLRCVFPDAKTKEQTVGSCGGYREIPQAVSLTYRFVFEQKDGRGSVRMSQ